MKILIEALDIEGNFNLHSIYYVVGRVTLLNALIINFQLNILYTFLTAHTLIIIETNSKLRLCIWRKHVSKWKFSTNRLYLFCMEIILVTCKPSTVSVISSELRTRCDHSWVIPELMRRYENRRGNAAGTCRYTN